MLDDAFSNREGSGARKRRGDDSTDYAHQHFVNLAAAAFLLAMAFAMTWTVKAMSEYEKTRLCLEAGLSECRLLDLPAHVGVQPPR